MKPMKSPLSPSDLEVLIHCHTVPSPHPRREARAIAEAIRMFHDAGMIEQDLDKGGSLIFRTTPKGAVFLTALCYTPEPVAEWRVNRKQYNG